MAEIGASSYRRVLLGDKNAVADFIREYSDALVRFAFSYVRDSAAAEDVAAESIALILLKGKHFPDEARLRAYLYKIARSKSLDHLRRHRDYVPLEDAENVLGQGDPAADYLRRERDRILYESLDKLPQQYRQVLILAYLEDFSPKQVASILGKSSKQVYNLLSRAKIALKQILEKEGVTYEDL